MGKPFPASLHLGLLLIGHVLFMQLESLMVVISARVAHLKSFYVQQIIR